MGERLHERSRGGARRCAGREARSRVNMRVTARTDLGKCVEKQGRRVRVRAQPSTTLQEGLTVRVRCFEAAASGEGYTSAAPFRRVAGEFCSNLSFCR
eukprot:1058075-Rhodomonas_salina.2